MGQPAANITTVTAHGGIVVQGAPTVLIGNMPASRIGDMHTCPLFDGPKPHVGGPIVLGSFNVLTCSVPQSFMGNPAVCVGPPDSLMLGVPTVLIGQAMGFGAIGLVLGGLMAGLMNFISGYPKAVMLPDGTVVTQYNEFITITGDAEFQAKVVRDLNRISSTESGQKLLDSMGNSGQHCTIRPLDAANPDAAAWTDPTPSGPGPYDGYDPSAAGTGNGADTQIWYDPDENGISQPPYDTADWASEENMPSDVTLFHEMTHCDDMMNGELDDNVAPGNAEPNSERRAVGLPPYDGEDFSENEYREDRGLPPRTFY
ncbi:MAG: M91 family zinc metallopeptidase [Bryobacterales bacterium]|nr:M91 family zinc metallopeptidase [Bryobacterales bacterium]